MPVAEKPLAAPTQGNFDSACQSPISKSDIEFTGGNDLQLLIDGPATFDSMLKAIDSAEKEILLETYIIKDDEVGKKFRDAMIARARQGVSVKVIYDGLASEDGAAFWSDLEEAGAELHEFHPPEPIKNADLSEYVTRDHRKVLIVDADIGFVGGINHYDAYLNQYGWRWSGFSSSGHKADGDADKWRDTHLRFTGPAVFELREIFKQQWLENQDDSRGFKPVASPASSNDPVRMGFAVARGENDAYSDIYHTYIHAMAAACESVWITQAYFMPNGAFLDTLADTARRGVDVRLLLPGISDWRFMQYAMRENYGPLLEAGVRIFEYQDGVLHAKTAVVDGRWSTIGSSNLDALSFLRNDEINAIIEDEPFAREMQSMFQADLEKSDEVTLKSWRERRWRDRFLGKLFQLFKPWL